MHLKRDFPRVSDAIIVRLLIIPAGFVLIDNVRENKLPGLLWLAIFPDRNSESFTVLIVQSKGTS